MPRITFVREHRVVETAPGRLLSDVAKEHGVRMCRETFAGTGRGDWTCWVEGAAGAVSAPGLVERLFHGARGLRRQANRVRVHGDVRVWTQAGPDDRLGVARPIEPPPRPTEDASAERKPVDAAGTAAFPYGDPRAVGKGTREAVARSTAKAEKKVTAAAKASSKRAPEGNPSAGASDGTDAARETDARDATAAREPASAEPQAPGATDEGARDG